jgi:hypothetical protein
MPTRTNKRTGEVQQTDANGNWVTITPPSQPSGIQVRGPDPMLPDKRTIAHNQALASQVAPAKAQADATIASAQAANALAIAQAQRDKAVADAKTAQIDASGGRKLTPEVRAQALKDYAFSDQLQGVIDNLRAKYEAGPGKTKGIMGSADYLPLTQNQEFDTAADAARGIIGQALGFTGSQLNTQQESEKNIGPFLPHSSDRDKVINDKLQYLQNLADKGRQRSVMTLGGVPDANGNIVPATGATRTENDPEAAAALSELIQRGRPYSEAVSLAKKRGFNPPDAKAYTDAVRYARRHKGATNTQATKEVPVGTISQMIGKAAQDNVGGALLATPVAAANAITGDRLASMAGDPNAAQGMAMLRQNNPISSLIGDVAGQATDEALLGRIPGMQGFLAGKIGRRVGDLGYGAFAGSGDSAGDDPATGALVGAGTNLLGGGIGRRLQRGVGKAFTGVRDPQVNYLASQGVQMTPGRIGRGTELILGHTLGGLEDRAAGLPGFDAVIGAARRRGDESFNAAAFRQAGGSGATGAKGLSEVAGLKNNAYDFLNGTTLPIDAQFAGRNAAVKASVPGLPGFGNEVGLTLGQLDKVSNGGAMAARDWQSALSSVRGDRASISGKPFASDAGNAMDEIKNNLLELADRQGPPGTVDNLNAANRLNAQYQVLAGALDNGPTQKGGQLFSAGRLDDVSRVNTRKYGGRLASLTGANRPFYDLSQAGVDVMPNLTPDSGTAGRLAVMGTLAAGGSGLAGASLGALANDEDRGRGAQTGGELGTGGYLGALTLAGLLYSKTGQKMLQKALVGQRPDRIAKLGDFLINKSATGGKVGSAMARQYLYNLGDLAQ